MKIILVNPMFALYGGVKGHGGSAPPINLGYLASFVRSKKDYYDISILDAEALELTYDDVESHLKQEVPDVVGITANTPSFYHVTKIAEICKKVDKNIKVVVGGPHPSALPEETINIQSIDYVVIGEGEITFLELLDAIELGKSLENVDGILYKKDGKVIRNRPRELIKNLDVLPYPARDLMPHHLYSPAPTKRVSNFKATSICSARGCPFNCTFCAAKVVWSRKYRCRSPQNVVDEIEYCVKEMDIREFNFIDELFTANAERVVKICEEIILRKLNIAFTCMSRVGRFVNKEILEAMKRAGCKQISFGIESGSQKILNAMKKGITIEDARNTIKLVKDVGIKTHVSYMIGNIGETEETIIQTIEFAKELDTDIAAFFATSPLPGTELWNEAVNKGYIRKDFEWTDFSPLPKNETVLDLPGLCSNEIKKWHRRAVKEYYLRPKYILKQAFALKSKMDVLNLIDGFKILLRLD